MTVESFSRVFGQALQGRPCTVIGLDSAPRALPMEDWSRVADLTDHRLLGLCHGSTIDIGCGPGRLATALAEIGQVCLGVDLVSEAVAETTRRGGSALWRSVFDPLPGEGRWRTALLADGNIGIGGDPVRLLSRARELIDPRGRVVVEVDPDDTVHRTAWATLRNDDEESRPFRWTVIGTHAITALAPEVGLTVTARHEWSGRKAVVLQEASC